VADLKRTDARLALLDVVGRGEVVEYQWDDERPSFWNKGLNGRGLMVTNRIRQLREAGWVRLRELPGHHVAKWELTETGREVARAGCREHRPEEQEQQR
jgi:hypothetical protein